LSIYVSYCRKKADLGDRNVRVTGERRDSTLQLAFQTASRKKKRRNGMTCLGGRKERKIHVAGRCGDRKRKERGEGERKKTRTRHVSGKRRRKKEEGIDSSWRGKG